MITGPLIILCVFAILGLGMAMAKDGQPKAGKYDFTTTLWATLIELALLYWHSQILLGND